MNNEVDRIIRELNGAFVIVVLCTSSEKAIQKCMACLQAKHGVDKVRKGGEGFICVSTFGYLICVIRSLGS